MSKIEKLIIACEDMTEVLNLDPKIETDDKSQMRLDLVEAAKLLKSSDMSKLKEETISILEKLGVELPKKEKLKIESSKKEKKDERKEKKDERKEDKKERKEGKKYQPLRGSFSEKAYELFLTGKYTMQEAMKKIGSKTGFSYLLKKVSESGGKIEISEKGKILIKEK